MGTNKKINRSKLAQSHQFISYRSYVKSITENSNDTVRELALEKPNWTKQVCASTCVFAGLQVKLTLSSNAILSITLIILEAESFKLRRLTGLTAYVSAGLANVVAACGLAHFMAAYGGFGSICTCNTQLNRWTDVKRCKHFVCPAYSIIYI